MRHLKNLTACTLLFFLAFLVACDNTVDINDDYKEIAIVYGLLDHTETTHYVKVTKAFLSESNVYLAAQNPSLSQYGADELEVWIEEYQDEIFRRTIYFDTSLVTTKEEGVFYFPNQIVYKSPENTVLDNDFNYKLFIKNTTTGKLIDSRTYMIGDVRLAKPRESLKTLSLTGLYPVDLEWVNGENGIVYDVSFRFFYTEIDASGDSTSHYVDWEQSRVRGTSTSGSEKFNSSYFGPSFYSFLSSAIDAPEQGMIRYSDSVHLVLYGGNEDLAIYMDVNEPSTSIVQERPQYTNITNGMGIFAARYRYVKPFTGLTARSLDTLYVGQYTKDLGFVPRPL